MKKIHYSFEKLWFLDSYGRVLCYAPAQKKVLCVPFQGLFVGGSVVSPLPFPKAFSPQWYDLFGNVIPDIALDIIPLGEDTVALRRVGTGEYLRSDSSGCDVFPSPEVGERETFCPLTLDVYLGLLLLSSQHMTKIVCHKHDVEFSSLYFPDFNENKVFCIAMGKVRISILANLDIFADIGRLKVGETKRYSFIGYKAGRCYDVDVTRLQQGSFE